MGQAGWSKLTEKPAEADPIPSATCNDGLIYLPYGIPTTVREVLYDKANISIGQSLGDRYTFAAIAS